MFAHLARWLCHYHKVREAAIQIYQILRLETDKYAPDLGHMITHTRLSLVIVYNIRNGALSISIAETQKGETQ